MDCRVFPVAANGVLSIAARPQGLDLAELACRRPYNSHLSCPRKADVAVSGTVPDVESPSDHLYAHLHFSHGEGAHCWTTDGREYVDLICGHGAVILGHAHPAVTAAVTRQLNEGTLLPGPGPVFDRLRAVLLDLYPQADDVLTFKTGSEAVAAGIRVSRAYTGRHAVLRVGFHGWHDQVVSPHVRCHSYEEVKFEETWPPGVPHAALAGLTHVWHGSDPKELVALVRARGDELAAVVVDPVQLRPPAAAAAVELARVVRDAGALLIFDESKTGFRVHLGGVQALYGAAADLTILSKALANGLPLAVVLGRRELITLARPARIKGTFGFETAAMAAALATVDTLQASDAPRTLNEYGTQLLEGLSDAITSAGLRGQVAAVPYHWPCLPYVHFTGRGESLRDAFYLGLLDRGVLMLHSHMSYASLALTNADVDKVVVAAGDVLKELASAA
jgi:glutamate-1-semialdehyde 2,1-aminomutase